MPSAHSLRAALQKKRCKLEAFQLQAHLCKTYVAQAKADNQRQNVLPCHGIVQPDKLKQCGCLTLRFVAWWSIGCGRMQRHTHARQPRCASRRPGRP